MHAAAGASVLTAVRFATAPVLREPDSPTVADGRRAARHGPGFHGAHPGGTDVSFCERDQLLRSRRRTTAPTPPTSTLRDEAPVWKDPRTGHVLDHPLRGHPRRSCSTPSGSRTASATAPTTRARRCSRTIPRRRSAGASRRRSTRDREALRGEGLGAGAEPRRAATSPKHMQMRRLFDHAFRPSAIKEIDPYVEELAYRLIDDVHRRRAAASGSREFAVPLPLYVIGRQMGVPDEDMPQIKAWTDAWIKRMGLMQTPEETHLVGRAGDRGAALLPAALRASCARARRHAAQRAREQRDPRVGPPAQRQRAARRDDGRPVRRRLGDDDERARRGRRAADRAARGLGAAEVRPGRSTSSTFVEEVLRLESPVQGLLREAAEDVELHGVTIPAGSIVNAPLRRGQPRRAAVRVPGGHRPRARAAAHATWRSASARTTASARRWPGASCYYGFKALVERIDDMWFIEGANDFSYHPNYFLRALKELHIGFKPREVSRRTAVERPAGHGRGVRGDFA